MDAVLLALQAAVGFAGCYAMYRAERETTRRQRVAAPRSLSGPVTVDSDVVGMV